MVVTQAASSSALWIPAAVSGLIQSQFLPLLLFLDSLHMCTLQRLLLGELPGLLLCAPAALVALLGFPAWMQLVSAVVRV